MEFEEFSAVQKRKTNQPSGTTKEVSKTSEPGKKTSFMQIVENNDLQSLYLILLLVDTFSSYGVLMIRAYEESANSSKSIEFVGTNDWTEVTVLNMIRVCQTISAFCLFLFVLEITLVLFAFPLQIFRHLGYIADFLIIGMQVHEEFNAHNYHGLSYRVLNILRCWRFVRFFNSVVQREEKKHELTKQLLDKSQRELKLSEIEKYRLENDLKKEKESLIAVETMLQNYKEEVNTLNEALKIAAMDIAEIAQNEDDDSLVLDSDEEAESTIESKTTQREGLQETLQFVERSIEDSAARQHRHHDDRRSALTQQYATMREPANSSASHTSTTVIIDSSGEFHVSLIKQNNWPSFAIVAFVVVWTQMLWTILWTSLILWKKIVSAEDRVIMEQSVNVFHGDNWVQERGVSNQDIIVATFVMKLDDSKLQTLQSTVEALSNPLNANYGKYLTNQEIMAILEPSDENIQLVTSYLTSNSIPNGHIEVSPLKTTITVRIPGAIAETMFQTQFVRFRSVTERDISVFRCTRPYSLPASIASVVSFVDDLIRFPSMWDPTMTYGQDIVGSMEDMITDPSDPSKQAFSSCGAECYGYLTPSALQTYYGLPKNSPHALPANQKAHGIEIASFLPRKVSANNLNAFETQCSAKASGSATSYVNDYLAGTTCELGACMDITLQLQFLRSLTAPYNIPITVSYQENFSLMQWITSLYAYASATSSAAGKYTAGSHVFLFSLANDVTDQMSYEFMSSLNTHFMLAAAKGFTLVYASGDSGVWGQSGAVGQSFSPDFPSSSPWLTVVGASNLQSRSHLLSKETVWECSGGGFSDFFPRPSYQDYFVKEYLSRSSGAAKLPESTLFNISGRGYPDVVALGGEVNPYCVVLMEGDVTVGVSSTVASSVVVATKLALINIERVSANKPVLGFANPLLYYTAAVRSMRTAPSTQETSFRNSMTVYDTSDSACFNDIADSSLNFCHLGAQGFPALEGWDPASGLGSIRYPCLLDTALSVASASNARV